jgi:hypothetical protein
MRILLAFLLFPKSLARLMACCLMAALLAACSPDFDWREVRGQDAPYVALFPAKPASNARAVSLNGAQVSMTLTAARAKGYSFAVSSAVLPDAAAAQTALIAMKAALVSNLGGSLRHERWLAAAPGKAPILELEAVAAPATAREPGRLLVARFIARGNFVYQAVVLGPDQDVPREEIEMFFASFKVE